MFESRSGLYETCESQIFTDLVQSGDSDQNLSGVKSV